MSVDSCLCCRVCHQCIDLGKRAWLDISPAHLHALQHFFYDHYLCWMDDELPAVVLTNDTRINNSDAYHEKGWPWEKYDAIRDEFENTKREEAQNEAAPV